jgi:hypothetical protein
MFLRNASKALAGYISRKDTADYLSVVLVTVYLTVPFSYRNKWPEVRDSFYTRTVPCPAGLTELRFCTVRISRAAQKQKAGRMRISLI